MTGAANAVRKPKTFSYNPALDGVRAFAVVAVMLHHAGLPAFAAGGRGVQVFFVLSGFLITSLLITERFRSGRIDVGRFYLRRFLRLYPALLLVLVVMVVVVPMIRPVPMPTTFGVLSILFYFSNWNWVLTGTNTDLGYLPHTWSLAVEEQFYLIWPAIVVILLSRKKASRNLLLVALALGAFSIADGLTQGRDQGDPFGFRLLGTDVQGEYLMVGCALAVVVARYPDQLKPWLRRLAWPALGAVALLAAPLTLGSLPAPVGFLEYLRAAAELSLFGVASAVVIGYMHFANPLSLAMRFMSFTPIVLLGRISYGVYLWHFPVFVLVRIGFGMHSLDALQLLLEFAITFAVAALSYAVLERPLLRLKDRVGASERRAPRVVAVREPA